MTEPFEMYQARFIRDGLAEPADVLMGVCREDVHWSKDSPDIAVLEPLFDRLDIHCLVWIRPSEPYRSIIAYLSADSDGTIYPKDMETRLFLQDLPVAKGMDTDELAGLLKQRKTAIVPEAGLIATGRESLKQAFVTISSACFACFIHFFSAFRTAQKNRGITPADWQRLEHVGNMITPPPLFDGELAKGPFSSEADILPAICEAGKQVVDLGLVDSFFGNVSYHADDMLYISETGTFLDDLDGVIARCPIDDPEKTTGKASSELPAHLEIIRRTGSRAILHGHPRFSVILSMDCDVEDCPYRGQCHRYCPYDRYACKDIPIVSGEVGGGAYGLCHTVPKAICRGPGVIVYGHGVFTCAETDFNEALLKLIDIERRCCIEYFNAMGMAK
ncbi:MAG: class II aldolase/adducin family protein [Desulfobacterales bacterium]|nr:class II aldolase/adducin family protein [Desulfobacterales bacterium]